MKPTVDPRARAANAPTATRTATDPATIARAFQDNLYYQLAKFPSVATRNDNYLALAYTVRDHLLARWIKSAATYFERRSRTVCYLSAEFLMGPQLGNHLLSLGISEPVRDAMASLGLDLEDLLDQELEPGLGHGGLGRLAACFLDSLATLEIPAIGYGIRYEFGIFDQVIRDGWQVEMSDKWLRLGHPWEIPQPEIAYLVKFGGHTEGYVNDQGRYSVRWIPAHVVRGTACDMPVPGYGVNTVNLLRLWKAEAVESFDFQAFNVGDYYRAVLEKVVSENITKVLYPNDGTTQGKRLRLQQQFFFASCALQDMIRLYQQRQQDLSAFAEKFSVQLNDTHPAIAVAELMRLLVDEHLMPWDAAWEVTRNTFAYTNHTLLPEALERWPVPLFAEVLPRHLEIIYEINRRFLEDVRARFPGDEERAARLSLIDETGERYVRMANLACVGSHTINGVARLHTQLLKEDLLRHFHDLWPGKFQNKTNGVTPRRFMLLSNPGLARLITRHLGPRWVRHLEEVRRLEPLAGDADFRREWRAIKQENKRALADLIGERIGLELDPQSLFDIQVKRLHEYKRQHLNALHIVTLYNRLRRDPGLEITPRTFIFGAKAAPAYHAAKLIIKLIHSIARKVNTDPVVNRRLRLVFIPNFNVKLAQRIYPAADLSEQISTAGKEASGTGNMKFAMNGALTIGTLDGANVEIREQVGPDQFFLFGLSADEVAALKARPYRPRDYYEANEELREAIDQIANGFYSPEQPGLFRSITDEWLWHDQYMLLADYAGYVECQDRVSVAYRNQEEWTRMSILNAARAGYFSSDRSIREYCEDIWRVSAVPIED
jgi:starch phosphorylase